MKTLLRKEVNKLIKLMVLAIAEEVEEEICVIKKKRIWIRKWINRRDELGATNSLLKEIAVEDPKEYFATLRMSESCFNLLLMKVEHQIQRKDTHLRSAIPARTKLQAVLYFLATGSSLRTLTHLFRLGMSTIAQFIMEVCEAIYAALHEFIKVPTTAEWQIIENGFRKEWNFPGCCGAIDGKHVIIKAPPEAGSLYYDYKEKHSIVLMAVVDHKYCFSYIDIGCNGRVTDGAVFRNCSLYQELERGILPADHFLVGDAAFPMKEYLLKPFPGNRLTLKQKIFNYRLSRARRIVENAFGILAARFRLFEKPIPYSPEKVVTLVKACCALHNWLRETHLQNKQLEYTVDKENVDAGIVIPGNWREQPEA